MNTLRLGSSVGDPATILNLMSVRRYIDHVRAKTWHFITGLAPSRARANAQTPSGDNARVSWARKCYPAKILAGQSESTSCIIA